MHKHKDRIHRQKQGLEHPTGRHDAVEGPKGNSPHTPRSTGELMSTRHKSYEMTSGLPRKQAYLDWEQPRRLGTHSQPNCHTNTPNVNHVRRNMML